MKLKNILLSLATLALLAGTHPTAQAQGAATADSGKTAAKATDSAAATAAATPAVKDTSAAPLSDSAKAAYAKNAALGHDLFVGSTRLINGGPSCITCHNAKGAELPEGGLLAKDLTHVYGRLGEAGLPAILGSTPFPAMASAYKNKPLDPKEITELTAFFKQVEETAAAGEPAPQYNTLLIGGTLGITVWMGLIFGLYYNRKKASVKQAIYDRQIQH